MAAVDVNLYQRIVDRYLTTDGRWGRFDAPGWLNLLLPFDGSAPTLDQLDAAVRAIAANDPAWMRREFEFIIPQLGSNGGTVIGSGPTATLRYDYVDSGPDWLTPVAMLAGFGIGAGLAGDFAGLPGATESLVSAAAPVEVAQLAPALNASELAFTPTVADAAAAGIPYETLIDFAPAWSLPSIPLPTPSVPVSPPPPSSGGTPASAGSAAPITATPATTGAASAAAKTAAAAAAAAAAPSLLERLIAPAATTAVGALIAADAAKKNQQAAIAAQAEREAAFQAGAQAAQQAAAVNGGLGGMSAGTVALLGIGAFLVYQLASSP